FGLAISAVAPRAGAAGSQAFAQQGRWRFFDECRGRRCRIVPVDRRPALQPCTPSEPVSMAADIFSKDIAMPLRQSDLMLMLTVLSLDFLVAGHSAAYATQFTVTPAQGQNAQQVESDQQLAPAAHSNRAGTIHRSRSRPQHHSLRRAVACSPARREGE